MKQEFEMLQQEMDDIIAINKDRMPVMMIGNVTTGMDTQERVNAYWKGLSDKYGFEQMSVEGSAKGNLFFLATPKPIVVPKTDLEVKIDAYIENCEGYMSGQVRDSIKKIISKLDGCGYQNEAGFIEDNIAFMALKKLV